MKIKIGEKIYDSTDEPIMVILSDKDKENIKNMLPECSKYCSFPDTHNTDEILDWMEKE